MTSPESNPSITSILRSDRQHLEITLLWSRLGDSANMSLFKFGGMICKSVSEWSDRAHEQAAAEFLSRWNTSDSNQRITTPTSTTPPSPTNITESAEGKNSEEEHQSHDTPSASSEKQNWGPSELSRSDTTSWYDERKLIEAECVQILNKHLHATTPKPGCVDSFCVRTLSEHKKEIQLLKEHPYFPEYKSPMKEYRKHLDETIERLYYDGHL